MREASGCHSDVRRKSVKGLFVEITFMGNLSRGVKESLF